MNHAVTFTEERKTNETVSHKGGRQTVSQSVRQVSQSVKSVIRRAERQKVRYRQIQTDRQTDSQSVSQSSQSLGEQTDRKSGTGRYRLTDRHSVIWKSVRQTVS